MRTGAFPRFLTLVRPFAVRQLMIEHRAMMTGPRARTGTAATLRSRFPTDQLQPEPGSRTGSTAAMSQPAVQMRTCRRCKQQFDPAANGPSSCHYHSALWTGGELSKAIGFCRESGAPEAQLRAVHGRTGLIRFWDCCGAEEEDAHGCCVGKHITYDDPE